MLPNRGQPESFGRAWFVAVTATDKVSLRGLRKLLLRILTRRGIYKDKVSIFCQRLYRSVTPLPGESVLSSTWVTSIGIQNGVTV